MKLLHLLLLYLFLPVAAISQEYSYANYSAKEGLAGFTVYCSRQDKEGFLWFGTETGLSRYDGTHFKNFTTNDGLPDNEILKLFVDSRNRIWMIPFKNSVCYYWKGKIYNEYNDSVLKKIKIKGLMREIIEDKDGNILIQETYSYHVLTKDNKVITTDRLADAEFETFQGGLTDEGHFRIAISSKVIGITWVDWKDSKTVINPLHISDRFYKSTEVYEYHFTPGLQVARRPDSILFHRSKGKELFAIPVPERFMNMARLNDSLFVINADYKCLIFNLNLRRFTQGFMHGYKVTSLLQDKEKNYWFTTMGDGVFRLGSTAFRNVKFTDSSKVLPVYSICKIDSIIYAGTDRLLLWSFNPRTEAIQKHRVRMEYQESRVYSLAADYNNKLLIGGDMGLFRLSGGIKQLLPVAAVKSLTVYKNSILVSTAGEVYKITDNDESYNKSNRLWLMRSTSAAMDDSNYYIGTLHGMYKMNKNKESEYLGEKNPLLSRRISAIVKTDDNIFWVATYGDGIVGYKNDSIFMNISAKNGLSSNTCRTIFVDDQCLWVGTDKGLNKITFNGNNYSVINYTIADGLGSNIVNSVIVSDSTVYVGTPVGMTYFREEDIIEHSGCELRITGINVSDHKWNFDTTGFVLPPRNNNIRFEFVGLSYRSAGDITYKYRLLGLDSSWKTTRETFLSYPSLPYGDYELQLIAINKFGIQSEMRSIVFEIEAKLLQKTWFRVFLLLLAIAAIWTAVWFYIGRIKKKQRQEAAVLQKMTELEQMALKAQMNPHFIFNSLNSIQQYVIEKDIAGANRVITGFSSLMRQTLDFTSKPEITLNEELQYLATYLDLEKVRMEDKYEFEICVDGGIKGDDYYVPAMILQPFVENSIRHGIRYRNDKYGKILIAVKLQEEKLLCIVEDNGVGRKVADQYKKDIGVRWVSKGMSLTADRIEMFNKVNTGKIEWMIEDLADEAGNATGTRVTIKFPI